MSPEGFISNIYGCKTDIWAFGVFVYELLHGYPPLLHCKTSSDLIDAMAQPMTTNGIKSSVSEELRELIVRCM
jgi:serine/threonine protein kinase